MQTEMNKAGVYKTYDNAYAALLDNVIIMLKTFQSQAYYLCHYEVVQRLDLHAYPVTVKHRVGGLHLAAKKRGSNDIDFLQWDEDTNQFVMEENRTLKVPFETERINTFTMNGTKHLYIQSVDKNIDSSVKSRTGHILEHLDVEKTPKFSYILPEHHKVVDPVHVVISDMNCILIMADVSKLFCEGSQTSVFNLKLRLDTKGAVMAAPLYISGHTHIAISLQTDSADTDSVTIYQCSNRPAVNCVLLQVLRSSNPSGVATISHRVGHFVAMSSGNVENAMHHGLIDIYRYDERKGVFSQWQALEITAPTQITFAVLPTDELVLYVLTNESKQPLVVYLYHGVAGFQEKISASILSPAVELRTMTVNDKHFVVVINEIGAFVLQAKFKGRFNN